MTVFVRLDVNSWLCECGCGCVAMWGCVVVFAGSIARLCVCACLWLGGWLRVCVGVCVYCVGDCVFVVMFVAV